MTASGYIRIPRKTHHFASSHGYVMEHRIVWEEHHKAILLPWAVVHHKNEVKTDNRIENLEAMMHLQHAHMHSPKMLYLDRICDICKRKAFERWYTNFLTAKGFLCSICYQREKRRKSRNYIPYIRRKCDDCKQYLSDSKPHKCPSNKNSRIVKELF